MCFITAQCGGPTMFMCTFDLMNLSNHSIPNCLDVANWAQITKFTYEGDTL